MLLLVFFIGLVNMNKQDYFLYLFAERYAMIKEIERTLTHLVLIDNAIDRLYEDVMTDSIVQHCLTGK